MSTCSTKGGLYERAALRFGLADGMALLITVSKSKHAFRFAPPRHEHLQHEGRAV